MWLTRLILMSDNINETQFVCDAFYARDKTIVTIQMTISGLYILSLLI